MLNLRKFILSVTVGIAVVLQCGLSLLGCVMLWQWYNGWPITQKPTPMLAVSLVMLLLILIEIIKRRLKQIIPEE